jgi:uncharacterized membrane protein YcaP (DUF421 family)
MKKEDIHLDDIYRILFGQAPPIFLLEVLIRTLIVYALLLFIIRWLGKRMSGQLTIMELAVMLTLGAIVCVPMQIPDRGLLQGVVLLLCAVGFQRGISLLGVKSGWFEDFTQGKMSMLIKNGTLELDELTKNRISHTQLFAKLRSENIYNLGTVDRVYLEACGLYSIFLAKSPRPGLPILYIDDEDIVNEQNHATVSEKNDEKLMACKSCGFVSETEPAEKCENCGENNWTKAII